MVGGRLYSSHFFSTPDAKSFFSEVGGVDLQGILHIALHDSEQIEVGGVSGSLELAIVSSTFVEWKKECYYNIAKNYILH